MDDYVKFLDDINEEGQVIFQRGKKYKILDENKDSYFIQRKNYTNEVSQFSKNLEGNLFTLVN